MFKKRNAGLDQRRADDNVRAMAKGYWITCYRLMPDEGALADTQGLLDPLLNPRRSILAREVREEVRGRNEQASSIIEFENVGQGDRGIESPEYQAALALLINSAERDVRIIQTAGLTSQSSAQNCK